MFYYTVGSIGDLFRYGYNGERLFCITFQICFTISIFYWQALLMFIIKCAFNQGKYIAGMVLPQNIDGVRSIEEPAKQFAQFFSQIISWAQEGANNQSNKN
ncbi:unnamed protein product [Caenorhabditis angaria]|uniref:Uncharacterized protein n=1 Tax=Caenorhabditis angaria TaxID=860376 RepID=A0A9P1J6A6_9PELO|nr:unnamed protein product [Caenorhabditis angaria]